MGYVTLCIEALTFHVPGVFETKCEAAPALGEHITLDDPFAEMTAPAEAGNIVKGDEVSPDPTDLQDVFVCTVLFFLDSSYSIRFLIVFFVSAFGHFWPAVFSQGTLVAQLVYCKPVPFSGSHLQVVSLAGSGKRHSRRCGRGACEVSRGL